MPWDYRVVKHYDEDEVEEFVTIHEAYYNEDDDGKAEKEPHSISSVPISPYSEDEKKLKKVYADMIMNAFKKPTLDYADF